MRIAVGPAVLGAALSSLLPACAQPPAAAPAAFKSDPAAIVVTDEWHRAIRSGYPRQYVEQSNEWFRDARGRAPRRPLGENEEVQVEIGRVSVIPRRLLDVGAIRAHVPGQPFDEYPGPGFPPP